jgi:hypothetical protein
MRKLLYAPVVHGFCELDATYRKALRMMFGRAEALLLGPDFFPVYEFESGALWVYAQHYPPQIPAAVAYFYWAPAADSPPGSGLTERSNGLKGFQKYYGEWTSTARMPNVMTNSAPIM